MITRCVGELEYRASPLLTAPHGFSTRLGGVSEGEFASLNLGCRRGDDPARVRENYHRFFEAVGADAGRLVMANQVHGTAVRRVGEEDVKPDLLAPTRFEADGLVTDVPGIALVVFSADCVPILLHDPVRGAVCAVHAGWRGTAAGMARAAVEAMAALGCRPEDIRAAIGPAIGPCCFETGEDVPRAVREEFGDRMEPCIHPVEPGRYRVDLKGLNAAVLRACGVTEEHMDVDMTCTCCEHERFWSHRWLTGHGDPGRRGSQGAVIVLEGER